MIIRTYMLFILLWIACETPPEKRSSPSTVIPPFTSYMHEVFEQDPVGYYVIIGAKVCSNCKVSTYRRFKFQMSRINSLNPTIITDLPQGFLDSLLPDSFNSRILCDSLSVFESFAFPRAYATIYKTKGGKIEDYAFFSDSTAICRFLPQSNAKDHRE